MTLGLKAEPRPGTWEPIEAADIRKGDKLRVEYAVSAVEGVVSTVYPGVVEFEGLHAKYNTYGAYSTILRWTLTPDPLPTEAGSVIIALRVRGVAGRWTMLLDNDGDWTAGALIGSGQWFQPADIEEWTLAKVVPV